MGADADVIVIGGGLAGAVLAGTLHDRGFTTTVFDAPKPFSASQAAAGVVNPVSMRRTVPVWRASELLSKAEAFYTAIAVANGVRLWHPLPMVRLFADAHEAAEWQQRMKDSALAPFLDGSSSEAPLHRMKAGHGHGAMTGCAWVDVQLLLALHRTHHEENGRWGEREVSPDDVRIDDGAATVHGVRARHVVWCTGAFAGLPGMVPTRGDVLGFTDQRLQCNSMVHRGGFLLPIGNHRYRVGSTFAWDAVWDGTTESGRQELLRKLHGMLVEPPDGPFEFASGVRPATRDRRPLLGQVAPHQFVFNGLGARGVLLAPWCAEHLIDHMMNGALLDPEVDAARFGTA